ncbi:MAG TPA: toll/interleukin-1 receptor domain-containing protein [Candidatus Angelobacter sp.]
MANEEHLKILNQGVDVWNAWRNENPEIHPDLTPADLANKILENINLAYTKIGRANLFSASLQHANLRDANLRRADLSLAGMVGVNLQGADLTLTTLRSPILHHADVSGISVGFTIFSDVDLSNMIGLRTVKHIGPSTIGIDTLYKSHGKIPEAFLRGCGVPEDFITYARSLVANPIEYYSCFISYSSKDKDFADRLHADLQAKAIRCWYAPEDLKIGDRFRTRIEESIRVYDKVMIVLSERSLQSAWVEDEVEAGLEREKRNPDSSVLFPIRLDNAVMETKQAWAATLRRTRHIGDFSNWKNHGSYQKGFERLLRDLKSQSRAGCETD